MQALAITHVSKYSFDKHDHDSKNCDICLGANYNKLSNNNAVKLAIPRLSFFKINSLKKTSLLSGEVKIFQARDPPLFFFS
jgi:hypothetical protein